MAGDALPTAISRRTRLTPKIAALISQMKGGGDERLGMGCSFLSLDHPATAYTSSSKIGDCPVTVPR
jgi:hypothetical protein